MTPFWQEIILSVSTILLMVGITALTYNAIQALFEDNH